MKQIITILSILFLFTSCSNDNSNAQELQFSLIAKSENLNGSEGISRSNLVIKDAEAWNNLITKMNSKNNLSKDFTETVIDFTKYQIIAVIDEVRPYNGYYIEIKSITENNNQFVVKVEQLNAGGIATVITQPYHIVKMPKTSKKVVFK